MFNGSGINKKAAKKAACCGTYWIRTSDLMRVKHAL